MNSSQLFLIAIILVLGALLYSRLDFKTPSPSLRDSKPAEIGEVSPPKRPTQEFQAQARSPIPVHSTPPKTQPPSPDPLLRKTPNPPPQDDGRLPRAPDEITEGQFIEKYQKEGIDELVKQKTLDKYPGGGAPLFTVGEDLVLGGGDFGEFQFRQWIGTKLPNGISPDSCLAVSEPNAQRIVGSIADGTLAVRTGPISRSFLLSISDTHYFLMYFDAVGTKEILNGLPPSPGSDGNGGLLYFARNPEGKLVYRARRLRWGHRDDRDRELKGRDFCVRPFASTPDR